jgi:HK97 family phage major capsid protein/HK97 family phage prohead protease
MANVNGTEIDLMPTAGMREEAERYRAWKADGEQGGTDVAATRASQILSGDELSPEAVITMAAWFARHEVDKQGQGFSQGEDGYPSPGRVAWAAWGGDAGQSWSTSKADRIKALQDRTMELARPYPNEHAARLADPDQYDELRRVNGEGGEGVDFIYGIKDGQSEIQAVRFDAARFSADEARQWLSDHDMSAILFEVATGERMQRSEPVAFTRAAQIAEDDRTLEFPFSSEYPVARYFGNEILSHRSEAVDLSRLNDGAPLLFNHDPDKLIGVVERAWVDEGLKRGYARVRMSRNPFAQEVMNDVRDGVLRNVSFGYAINDMEQRGEDFIVTRWSAHELSLVSIPADPTIGVGRSMDAQIAAQAASIVPPSTDMEDTTDLMAVRAEAAQEAAKAERARISGITAITEKHGMADLGRQLIESGRSLDEARAAVLDQLGAKAQPVSETAGDIGLTAKETREFSFQRAINALANPGDRKLQEAAAFERECSEAAAQRAGKVAQGIMVPSEVLRRDLTVGTASAAGDLVGVDFRPGSFIELLRNRSALSGLGVTSLTGLSGNVAIPRQTGAATAYWVAESGSPTESQQTVDQVNLSPKTVGAYTDYSRRLMLQASIDVEQMIRQDLATVLALEIDRVGLYGLGNTNQPLGIKLTTGINTEDFGAATPTYAEVVSMESKIAADNADIGAMAYLMNATMRGNLKTKDKGTDTGAYVYEPGGTVNGYNAVVSNQVESGDVFFAVWSQLIMAMWSGLDLTVDPYTHSTSGTIRVVALQDVDFAVRHPEGFCRGNNTL